jgi:predicted transposase/invertase (TIGR01784 family)
MEECTMTNETLLSPKNDFLFKRIFADPKNKDILEDFLKSVLTIPEKEYKKITLADPHLLRRYKQSKLGILDVRLETLSGHAIDIEIQVKPFQGMENRIAWYNAKLYSEQPVKGDSYHGMKKAISIVICDYVIRPGDDVYHDIIHLQSSLTRWKFCDTMEIHVLELPKVKAKQRFSGDHREEKLIQWLRFFKAETRRDYMVLAKENPILNRAFKIIVDASGNERLRRLYDRREKALTDMWFIKSGAFNAGLSEGRTEGAEEKARETARKLKSMGLSVSQIAEATDLSPDSIEGL